MVEALSVHNSWTSILICVSFNRTGRPKSVSTRGVSRLKRVKEKRTPGRSPACLLSTIGDQTDPSPYAVNLLKLLAYAPCPACLAPTFCSPLAYNPRWGPNAYGEATAKRIGRSGGGGGGRGSRSPLSIDGLFRYVTRRGFSGCIFGCNNLLHASHIRDRETSLEQSRCCLINAELPSCGCLLTSFHHLLHDGTVARTENSCNWCHLTNENRYTLAACNSAQKLRRLSTLQCTHNICILPTSFAKSKQQHK